MPDIKARLNAIAERLESRQHSSEELNAIASELRVIADEIPPADPGGPAVVEDPPPTDPGGP